MSAIERFEVNATPVGFEGLTPKYEIMLYRSVKAGICGPFSETVTVVGFPAIAAKVYEWGYVITDFFGPVCANGFATAPVSPRE
jgi:hypothetical protein